MEKGDHLISARIGYSHHGLYIGRNKVIHYAGSSFDESGSGTVEITSVDEFCQGNGFTTQTYPYRLFSREESVERAKSRLGEAWYNTLLNNCEHFVTWCILGLHSSAQVNNVIEGVVMGSTLFKQPVDTVAIKTIADFALRHTENETVRSLVPGISTALSSAGAANAQAGVATGVVSTLAATTLSAIALPAIAGTLIGVGAFQLLDNLFEK
ncbi:lecithin retinol acyltransferase family protein [uncultured Deefgea sp.]|uniref:lecithin retinol acyltransferase family protein n=1 Tax=uncultured Deefgea sp. TaxID=1304914 RepID=UPI002599D6BD|nr:lecithin retinol acyltransferase family protein [uncultured Deefgea sp.]